MSGNVHALTQRSAQNVGAYDELNKTLGIVNWSIQVQVILSAANIPIGSELAEDPNTTLPTGSVAQGLGHNTLGEFIKSKRDKLGLEKEWSDWSNQAKAYRYKQNFNIYNDKIEEILSQVNDVSKVIGRIPYNAADYHQHKDTILINQKRDSDRRVKLQTNEMHERINDLMRMVEKEKTNSSTLQQKATETQAKLDAALHEMEQQLDAARISHDRELERKLIAQRSEIEETFKREIETLRQHADMRLQESQERLDEMTLYYTQNFVSKKDHEIVSHQLTRAREENFNLIGALNESNKKLEETLSTLDQVEKALSAEKEKNVALSSEVERLSVRMNAIVRAPSMGDNDELVSELQNQIDDLMGKMEIVGTENSAMAKERRGLQRKLVLYKQKLSESTSANRSLRFKLKKANTTAKIRIVELTTMKKNMWVLSAVLGVSVLTTGVLIATA